MLSTEPGAGQMDIHTWELLIAIGLVIFGSITAFNDRHYAKAGHDEVSKRLAKLQGKMLLVGGIILLGLW
jgi:hypothetical protein